MMQARKAATRLLRQVTGARLSRIIVYPIKSLDGVEVEQATITAGGILEHDRVWSIRDAAGAVMNAKRDARVQRLRSTFSRDYRDIFIGVFEDSVRNRFALEEPARLNAWLSDYFGCRVHLQHETLRGFPDDDEASGPTLTTEASLAEVASWFCLSLENTRRRFRANLELSGGPVFLEDALSGVANQRVPFTIGEVDLLGHNPCQRCVVPSRDPDSGVLMPGFQRVFASCRKRTLPAWAEAIRFNHYYRFALNTSIPPGQAGRVLQVGDLLQAAQ